MYLSATHCFVLGETEGSAHTDISRKRRPILHPHIRNYGIILSIIGVHLKHNRTKFWALRNSIIGKNISTIAASLMMELLLKQVNNIHHYSSSKAIFIAFLCLKRNNLENVNIGTSLALGLHDWTRVCDIKKHKAKLSAFDLLLPSTHTHRNYWVPRDRSKPHHHIQQVVQQELKLVLLLLPFQLL